jgi:hypothetical protein
LLEGFRAVGADRELRLLAGVYAAQILVQALFDVLLVIAALEALDMGLAGAGWLSTAWGLETLGGGAVALVMLRSGRPAGGIARGSLLAGLPVIAIGVSAAAAQALVVLAITGVGLGMLEIALLTLTQRLAADDVLARMYGVQETVMVIATTLGSVLATVLVACSAEPAR